MKKLLVICGATATGKTDLAVECALKLNTDVISADSQLIYRGLNIGTAKPSLAEMRGVRHHMIDVVDADASFSVSDYARMAEPIVENLLGEGRTPVVCGGTGFYINSLLFDLSYGNAAADDKIREKYNNLLKEKGKEYLYGLLKAVDAETAEKLHVNDSKRVIRALEIFEITGRKKSQINDCLIPRRDYVAVSVNYPRDELYERIDRRVDAMFENGLIEEVKGLLRSGVTKSCQSMQAIGYKEVLECINNGDKESTMRDIIKQNTRHYAKRQITFFKKLEGLIWLDPQEAAAEKVLGLLGE